MIIMTIHAVCEHPSCTAIHAESKVTSPYCDIIADLPAGWGYDLIEVAAPLRP